MAGLVPAIHVLLPSGNEDVDARHKAGHDVVSHPSATASPPGWKISVAPKLVPPSRSTTLGQANLSGIFYTRASS